MPSSTANNLSARENDLEPRIEAVLNAMAGYPELPPSLRALAFLVCDGDAAPHTFNKLAKGANAASSDTLYRLHHALRLHEIDLPF
jgi:hypothetical protein